MINSKEEFIKEIEDLETTKEKGDYFLQTLCPEFFPDEDINYLDGSGDGGIDAYFTSNNTWSIVQSKYGSSYRGIDSVCGEFSKILVHLEDESFTGKDSVFTYFRDFLQDKSISNKSVNLFLLTCDRVNESELNAFNTIRNIFSSKYNVNFEIDNLYPDLLFSEEPVETKYEIELPGNFIHDEDGSGQLVGKVRAVDLYKMMKSFESLTGDIKLFYKSNIRLFLSNKLAKSITETISKEPNKFFERNNGITILTDGIKYNDIGTLVVCNPDCVNGCQSSWNTYKYIKNSGISTTANVCITVLDVSKLSKEDIAKITECRNKQTAIKDVGRIFILDDKVSSLKNTLSTEFGKTLQIKKGEFTPKRVDFLDLLSICFCIIDADPGTAKNKNSIDYNSKRGFEFLDKLNDNKDLLILAFRLAEICEDIKKKSSKYYISALRHTQISVLYALITKTVGKEDYSKFLKILNDAELFDYFMKSSTNIIQVYTDIGSRSKAKFKYDYDTDNIEQLSKTLKLSSAEKLNDLMSDWFFDKYKDDKNNHDIIEKVNKVIKQ